MGNVTMLAVTRSDILVTLHIVALVVAFGGAFAYPIWFRMIRNGTREQRSFFHAAQARLGKFLIMPAGLVVFATGAWLASDLDVWGEAWVLIPAAILVVILVVGAGLLGPSEERLSRQGEGVEYEVVFRRVKVVTSLFIVLVLGATFMMVAHIPDWGGAGGGGAGVARGASLATQAGCLSCHRIGTEGTERPGGDLSTVGARLQPSEIRKLLLDPPPGMPSYDDLPAAKLDALVGYLSGLR